MDSWEDVTWHNLDCSRSIRLRVGMAWDVHAGSQYGFVWAWHAGSQTQANMVDVIHYLRHAPELRLPRCWPEDW